MSRIHFLYESKYYNRVMDKYRKVDRYGKKYSWIAYFKLSGWLQDQGFLSRRQDEGRTWDVDIDPSFPSSIPEHQLISRGYSLDSK